MGGPLVLVFFRQLYFTGVQSAGIVMLLAALVGGGFVLSFENTLPIAVSDILELLATLMVQVLGVILTLLVMGARSLSAISAEMAMVRVTGERSSLERLGVDTRLYLLMPRVLAPVVSGAILYLYFIFTALLVGALVINHSYDLWEVVQIFRSLKPTTILLGSLRTGLFAGLAIAYVLSFSIRRARRFPDVALAASNGVFQGIVVMLLLEVAYQGIVYLLSSVVVGAQ